MLTADAGMDGANEAITLASPSAGRRSQNRGQNAEGGLERTPAGKAKQLTDVPPDSGPRAPAPAGASLLEHGAEDRELLRRIAAGENAACTELYQRFSTPLFAKIFFIVGNASDAEDVLQETFLYVWNRAATYDSTRASVFSWVMVVARSKALDRWRAQQRYLRATCAAEAEICAGMSEQLPNGNAVVKQVDDRYHILSALNGIARHQRAAIVLCFFNGMTQAEISAELSQPLGTVKARIRRGLRALRKALAEQNHSRGGSFLAVNGSDVEARHLPESPRIDLGTRKVA